MFKPGLWFVLFFLSILLHTYGGDRREKGRGWGNKSCKKCN